MYTYKYLYLDVYPIYVRILIYIGYFYIYVNMTFSDLAENSFSHFRATEFYRVLVPLRPKGERPLRLRATPRGELIRLRRKRVHGLCGVGASVCAGASHRMWGEFAIKAIHRTLSVRGMCIILRWEISCPLREQRMQDQIISGIGLREDARAIARRRQRCDR